MAGGFETAIGVFWDLNTCPVPDGMDPGLVRPSIISALQKFVHGHCRITIFAVGNLDNVSPGMLERICSSGIFIRHTVYRMSDVYNLVRELREMDSRLEKLLLITGDSSWQYDSYSYQVPYILRAYPKDVHPGLLCTYRGGQEWIWENFLEEYSRGVGKKRMRMDNVESALSCKVCDNCQFSRQNFADFIKHLKTDEEHKQNYLGLILQDEDGRPFMFCEACKYPANDDHNMAIHLKSSEHKDSLYKTVRDCKFCKYTGNDMAIHYNSEEHTQKEIAFVLADECHRKRAFMEKLEADEQGEMELKVRAFLEMLEADEEGERE